MSWHAVLIGGTFGGDLIVVGEPGVVLRRYTSSTCFLLVLS